MTHLKSGGRPCKQAKAKKPHPDFPLFPHATGRWAKKVKGQLRYFGKVADDPDGKAALEEWLRVKDDLLAGRRPRSKTEGEGLTVRDLLNRFLTAKKLAAEGGEITLRMFRDYHSTCRRVGDVFGLTPLVTQLTADDFQTLRASMAKTMGLASIKTEIQKTRAIFNYAYNAGLIDRPIRYGPAFKAPSEKVLRRARRQNGPRMFDRDEVRALLAAAGPTLRAMILLGVNCGFGNSDCATLPRASVDLEAGWVTHPRPKTGADRRCPLWPETVAALRVVYANRPEPKDPANAGLVFVTEHGEPFVRLCGKPAAKSSTPASWTDSVQSVFYKALKATGLQGSRRGFYTLRHVFRTVADEALDQVACDYIMGHVRDDMASVYRERIADDRLLAVTKHVRRWLLETEETR